jgi:hypothetical protein
LAVRAGLSNSDCLDCHSDNTLATTNAAGAARFLFVNPTVLAASVHKTNACVSCHTDVTTKHPDDNRPVAPVNCARCHGTQGESYGASVHGLARKAGHDDAAACADCHGSHDILPPTSPASPLHFVHQAQTCGQCHTKEARSNGQRSRQGHGHRQTRRAHLHRLPFGA